MTWVNQKVFAWGLKTDKHSTDRRPPLKRPLSAPHSGGAPTEGPLMKTSRVWDASCRER